MQKEEAQKLLFVINPVSGGKEKNNWEANIRQYFKTLPHTIEFYLLQGKDDTTSIQHHIQSVQPNKVVAVGGDGTIKLVAELLQQTSIPLGIIPAGSANGMAKELSIPDTINEALEVILYGQCSAVDSIKINNEEICIHLSDLGLNALLIKYFENSDKRGMWGYGKAIFKVLWTKQLMYATIKTDKETIKRKAFMIVLANARTYGTGAIINPEGNVQDGLFEIVVVRKLHVFELLKMLITHKPFDKDKIEIFQTQELHISLLKNSYFQVDGEYRGKVKEINAQVVPKCIKLMLPQPNADEEKLA